MIDKDRLWNSVQTLGAIGETNGAMMRVTGTDADKRARDTLVDWFEEAGLDVSIDPIGNIIARREGRSDLSPVITGSHVDTVPRGGKFDGVVGVLGPLEVVRAWNDADVMTDRPIELVIFTEEEGTRFGTGLLGSFVASGKMELDSALALTDENGITVKEALQRIGYNGTGEIDLVDAAAFVEMHVEQGPILDDSDVAVGIVEAIAGITHHSVRFEGEANHAGNTPMDMRRDGLMGAAEFALTVEDITRDIGEETVGTVGKVSVLPNGTNVIPEEVTLGVDIRDIDGDRLKDALSRLRQRTEALTERRSLEFEWETLLDVSPSTMDPNVWTELISATEACEYDYVELLSGAGHDAMNVQEVAPTGMLFVPSQDGISHSPREFTSPDDLYRGTKVLGRALEALSTVE